MRWLFTTPDWFGFTKKRFWSSVIDIFWEFYPFLFVESFGWRLDADGSTSSMHIGWSPSLSSVWRDPDTYMRLGTILGSSYGLELVAKTNCIFSSSFQYTVLRSMHSGMVELPKRESSHVTGISFLFGHGNRRNVPPAEFALSVLSSNHANTVITYRRPASSI